MLMTLLIILILGGLFWMSRKPSSLPPGRWGVPVIGYVPLYTRDATKIIMNLRKKYGDIFTWKLGGRVMVFFNEYKLIKTTFSKAECQGRPDFFSLNIFRRNSNTGLMISSDNVWSEGRRFALQHLKDFGMGKSCMEDCIQYEAEAIVKSYEQTAGMPVEVSWIFNVAALNVIWKLVADQRYDINDEEIISFNKMISADLNIIQGSSLLLDFFPGLDYYTPKFIQNNWMRVNEMYHSVEVLTEYINKVIDKHEKTLDQDNPRDFIDAYLIEIQKQKGDSNTIFKEDRINLITCITDLFVAGSETTSSTTRWLVLLMALNPQVQEKMQKEIDQVVPRDRTPSLEDKGNLPYTEAVIMETHRFASLAPLGMIHAATEDVQIENYLIPKGTMLFANIEICHRDPKYFERPNEFYPEHFLDDQGHVITKKEGFLPFSLGRRQCLGESLAKMELFLFATCLFQKFFITPPEGVTLTTETDETQMLFNFVKPYKVVMTKRF